VKPQQLLLLDNESCLDLTINQVFCIFVSLYVKAYNILNYLLFLLFLLIMQKFLCLMCSAIAGLTFSNCVTDICICCVSCVVSLWEKIVFARKKHRMHFSCFVCSYFCWRGVTAFAVYFPSLSLQVPGSSDLLPTSLVKFLRHDLFLFARWSDRQTCVSQSSESMMLIEGCSDKLNILTWPLDFCRAVLCVSMALAYVIMCCLTIHLSRSWILLKRINVSLKFFQHRVATTF